MNYSQNIIVKIYNCRKKALLLIFLLSLLVSFAFLFFLGGTGPSEHAVPGTDYFNCYKPFAESILSGEGAYIPLNLAGHEGEFFVCSPPGYPLYLTIVFGFSELSGINALNMVVYFNILVVALSACLLFLVVDMLFNRKIAFISSFLWLSYPFNLWFLKNPNTEIPFIFLLLFASWIFISSIKRKKLAFIFIAGLILGALSLVRPIALFLPIIFIFSLFFLLRGESLKKKMTFVTILLIGSLIPVLLWEIGLFITTNQFILMGSSGPPSLVDGLTFALKPGSAGDQVIVSKDLTDFMVRAETGNLDNFSKVLHFLKSELLERPIILLKLLWWKLLRSWYATSQMWWETKILLVQLIYLLPGIFGIIYLFKKFRSKLPEIIFILSVILYFWAMTVVALSILRYMVPAMAFFFIFTSATVALIIDSLFKKRKCKDEA